jgi:signal transduction histidine kinase/ligand-binding sensor domain-containing protein
MHVEVRPPVMPNFFHAAHGAAFLIVLTVVVSCHDVHAQSYPFQTYTTAEGLVQSAVSCFHQDSRGYLWVGTWGGFSRYDGHEFWSYRNSAFRVTCISDDANDSLWVGTTAGLARFAFGDTVFRWSRAADHSIPSDQILSMLKDHSGNMWVGTDKGLAVFTTVGKRLLFDRTGGLQDDYIADLKEDNAGAILIASSRGVMRCRLNGFHLSDVKLLRENAITGQLIVLSDGSLLATSPGDRSVMQLRDSVWHRVFCCDDIDPSIQVRSLAEDDHGVLWIGTTLGLVVLENDHMSRIPRNQRLSNQYIATIYKDREHVLWFGSESGAFKLAPTPFRNYSYATGLEEDHVIAIFVDRNETCWLGTYHGVTRLARDGGMKSFGVGDGLPHPTVHAFAQGLAGNVWIGSWTGLVLCERDRLRTGLGGPLGRTNVIRLYRDHAGFLWCGGRGRIFKMTPGGEVVQTLGPQEGIPDCGISALFMDAGGILWFGTDSHGCGYYRDGRVTRLGAREGLPDPWVMSIAQDRHGTIWCATQHGAVFWDGNRFEAVKTAEEELRIGIVSFVVRDSMEHMWFGTQRGIYEWCDSLIRHFDTNDGLVADPTRCGYVDACGDLWVGTVGGVSRLTIGNLPENRGSPPVQLDGLSAADDSPNCIRGSFSYDENTITAYFNSLSFRDERHTEFQWMLAGFDAAWQPPRTERSVRYTHLPSGDYEFLVRVRNGNSPWSDPARAAFVIHPPIWGTWWFLGFSVVTLAAGLVLVYRRRVRSLEKEKRAEQEFSRQLLGLQEGERKRIAGELHDSIVQNLLVAKNKSLLGLQKARDPVRVSQELTEISGALSDAIEEVRQIAHNLRPYQLDRLGLTQALRSLVDTVNESSVTVFATDIDNIDGVLTPDMCTTLYRILQEALNNILKHACATHASIAVRHRPGSIVIAVRDDGVGFRPVSASAVRSHGFGLTGIERRVRMLHGTLEISSEEGAGTLVSITIPMHTG